MYYSLNILIGPVKIVIPLRLGVLPVLPNNEKINKELVDYCININININIIGPTYIYNISYPTVLPMEVLVYLFLFRYILNQLYCDSFRLLYGNKYYLLRIPIFVIFNMIWLSGLYVNNLSRNRIWFWKTSYWWLPLLWYIQPIILIGLFGNDEWNLMFENL